MENACAVSHEKTIEERLREEIYTLTNGGICEVAARNPSVMEYMRHWEERALKAEAALSALSHPEPVAQEAVALPHLDKGEFKPCIVINEEVGLTEAIFEDTAYIAEPVFPGDYHWIDKHIAVEDGRLVGLTVWKTAPAHPSPSPEQGDDLVQRLTEVYEHDWRISFLAHTSDTAREAATELSALRARVAELEARATPQAGASADLEQSQ